MNSLKAFAIVVVILGVLAIGYGGFSYTKESTALKVGAVELKVQEKKNVNIPLWAGIAAVVGGGLVLVGASRRN